MSELRPSFLDDPRYIALKADIVELMGSHQSQLNAIASPDPSKKVSYEALMSEFASYRGGNLYYPYLSTGLGNGAFVQLADGSVKLDFISGIGAHWAHGDPALMSAGLDAALMDTVMQGNLQQHTLSMDVYERFCRLSGLDHCFVTTSGAMAAENALKIAFHHFKGERPRILAFEKCFIGRTLSLAHITDNAAYRVGLPQTVAVDYVPFYDAEDPEGSTQRALDVLRSHLIRFPHQHAVMCMELIQGEGGYFPGSKAFFHAIMSLLKEHGVLVMADEIQSFGRTENPFAFQAFECESFVDIVTVGKLSQVCATLYKKALKPQPGLISQTFTASTSALHAASVILKAFEEEDFFGESGQVMTHGCYFQEKLSRLEERYPDAISGPFGYGLMVAFKPYDGSKDVAIQFAKVLFEKGLIGFIAGRDPTRIRFLMPVGALSTNDIDTAIAVIEETIHATRPTP
jgi:acetylornithine aminotransferase